MHNAAIAQLGLDYVYLPFPVAAAQLSDALAGFAAIDVRGFNITIPHKQAILPLLTEVSELAQAIGAVNTVARTDTGWYGTNTDVAGFLAPLTPLKPNWSATDALVLGCGGAARAVVAGCAQLGCRKIWVAGRDRHKLIRFQQSWGTSPRPISVDICDWQDKATQLFQAGLVVNTTPIGMAPQIDQSPLTPMELQQLPAGAIVYDLIYTPCPTRLLQEAVTYGAIAIDGLEMLIQQGAAALELWLQQPVPVDIMRYALQQRMLEQKA